MSAGTVFYRVYRNSSGREANAFNPGVGDPTRFAFFGSPKVPVLYGAETEKSAVAESILHDVPITGGRVNRDDYGDKLMGRVVVQRGLKLAAFMGGGFRTLGVEASNITLTDASRYEETVGWAEAAHQAGFDGCVWMSRQHNTDMAYVFFGDAGRVQEMDLVVDRTYGRAFAFPKDLDWLTDMCGSLRVDVLR